MVFCTALVLAWGGKGSLFFWVGGVFVLVLGGVFPFFSFLSDQRVTINTYTDLIHFLRCSQPVLIQSRSNLGLDRIEFRFFSMKVYTQGI